MAVRCPKSTPLGIARLMRHRLVITPEGYASVMRDPRGVVHGVLWDANLADMRALDAFEEISRGLYRKIQQPVVRGGGVSQKALVYVGKGEGGRPRPGYMEGVVASARAWELPPAYVRDLRKPAGGRRSIVRAAMRHGGPCPAAVRDAFRSPLKLFQPAAAPNRRSNSRRNTASTSAMDTGIPRPTRLVTPRCACEIPQGTMPEKCDRSGSTLNDRPWNVTQRRTRTPMAAILSSAISPSRPRGLSGRATHTPTRPGRRSPLTLKARRASR